VHFQLTQHRKSLIANRANERQFASVQPFVYSQIALFLETFATETTFVRLLVIVRTDMDVQIVGLSERPCAITTFVRLLASMDLHVITKTERGSKR